MLRSTTALAVKITYLSSTKAQNFQPTPTLIHIQVESKTRRRDVRVSTAGNSKPLTFPCTCSFW